MFPFVLIVTRHFCPYYKYSSVLCKFALFLKTLVVCIHATNILFYEHHTNNFHLETLVMYEKRFYFS